MSESSDEVAKLTSRCAAQRLIESIRRYAIALAFLIAALLATWTGFQPYYAVDITSEYELEKAALVQTLPESRSEDSLLAAPPADEKLSKIEVSGPEWKQWFMNVEKTLKQGKPPKDWRFRLSADNLRDVERYESGKTSFEPHVSRILFFTNEEPLAKIFKNRKPRETVILTCVSDKGVEENLTVFYSPTPELVEFSGAPYGLPDAFSYPVRQFCYLPLLIGFLAYLLLPWPAGAKNTCMYKRGIVIAGDLLGILLYGSFAVLPFFIIGAAQNALTSGLVFTAIFWGMASFGLCALWWSYFFAVYRIDIFDEFMILTCPKGIREIQDRDVKFVEPVRVVPPQWLIFMTYLAAIFSRGSSSIGHAGRASLLEASSSDGICIGTASGEGIYIWLNNSLGQGALKNIEQLEEKILSLSANKLEDVRVFEAVFPPIIEDYSRAISNKKAGNKTKHEKPAVTVKNEPAEDTVSEFNSIRKAIKSGQELEKPSTGKGLLLEEEKYAGSQELNAGEEFIGSAEMVRLAEMLHKALKSGQFSKDELKRIHSQFIGTDSKGDVWTVSLKNHAWNKKVDGKWIALKNSPEQFRFSRTLHEQIDKLSKTTQSIHPSG